jgi:hypothetical protein
MTIPLSAAEVLNREYLEVRSKILEVAAALDRLDRAAGEVADDPRMKRIHESLRLLLQHPRDRAEQVQLVFSLPYEQQWQAQFEISPRQG